MNYSKTNLFLHRQIIIDHYTNPVNWNKEIPNNKYLKYYKKNPYCIDEITLFVLIKNEIIKDIKFNGNACSICIASIDIMITAINNKSFKYILNFIANYLAMIRHKKYNEKLIGELICLVNTYKLPARIKCATLGSSMLKKIIIQKTQKDIK